MSQKKRTTKVYYKIWTYIERIDEDNDSYKDVGEPLSVGEFLTLRKAEEFREDLFANREILDEKDLKIKRR